MTQIPDIPLSRQQIRQQTRLRRRALTSEQQTQFALQAADRMMAYPPVLLAHTVAVFLSFDGELDTQPLIEHTDWNTILGDIAERLSDTIAKYGRDSIMFYVSGQLLTEDYYVANKFIKGFIGNNNM